MENVIDLITKDSSPSEISGAIKSAIFAKAAEKIDEIRPLVANSLFGVEEDEVSDDEIENEDNEE